jgi:hypothetical protein
MWYIYYYWVGKGQLVSTVQVQRVEYQQLTGCLKYLQLRDVDVHKE